MDTNKYEFIHNAIKHIPDKNFKMVIYFGIHARRAKKAAHIALEKLGLVVKAIIRPFSWRKNVKENTGNDPLKFRDCGGEMLLYKVVYRNKKGEPREYGGLDMLLKKISVRVIRFMKKKKSYRKPSLRKERKLNTVSYVCDDCGAKEEIPKDVLEYFDEVNLQ